MLLRHFCIAALAGALSTCLAQRQTLEEAAVDARRILSNEDEGVLLSVYQDKVAPFESIVGAPIGIMVRVSFQRVDKDNLGGLTLFLCRNTLQTVQTMDRRRCWRSTSHPTRATFEQGPS